MARVKNSFDRSLKILNTSTTILAFTVGLLTLAFIVVGALGIFQYTKWIDIRKKAEGKLKEAEEDTAFIKRLRSNLEKDVDTLRRKIEHYPELTEPSEEMKKVFDEFSQKFAILKLFGMPLNIEDYLSYAFGLSQRGHQEEALKAINNAIKNNPNYSNAYTYKGLILLNSGQHKDALEAFKKAIAEHPYAHPWNYKGVTLAKLNRPDEALEAINESIRICPNYADALYNRANIYAMKGAKHKQKAFSNLKRAVELNELFKERAKQSEFFEKFRNDDEFKKLVE